MKPWIWSAIFIVLSVSSYGNQSIYSDACKGRYAYCMSAKCSPTAIKSLQKAACLCDVKTGYSVAIRDCQNAQKTPKGALIFSRYYPIKSYKICTNDAVWAYCLDAPCVIDSSNPNKANCLCNLRKNKGSHIVVTDNAKQAGCNAGIISSATVLQIKQLTNFLKTQASLPPNKISVTK